MTRGKKKDDSEKKEVFCLIVIARFCVQQNRPAIFGLNNIADPLTKRKAFREMTGKEKGWL